MNAYIDKIFRGYGEEFFGKDHMDNVTDNEVEEARCFAMSEANRITGQRMAEGLGRLEDNTIRSIFCNYVFAKFLLNRKESQR